MENISRAIFHTLMHSMWQGFILALLAGLIMVSTRKLSASLRYRLLIGSLLLFVVIVVYTLVIELNVNDLDSPQTVDPRIRHSNLINVIFNIIQQHAIIFVAAWFSLVLIKSFRLVMGLYTIKRLNSVKISPMPVFWEERFKALTETMKISRPVTLLESGIAKVPLLIGYLKPVILVPVGLVNSLEPEQVEAILLHELAHILRKDYLVNLIQKIIESLLFFNPAVLWVSYLIRSERENCCDDIVISQTKNRVGYMRALVGFEEYRQDLPDQVLAVSGNAGAIPQRIERMISGKNRSLLKLEVIILSLMTILFATVSMDNFKFSANPPLSVSLKAAQQTCTTCPYMNDKQICWECYMSSEDNNNPQSHCASMLIKCCARLPD